MITTIMLRIEHKKPLHPDFIDIAAGRVYTIDKVDDVTVSLVSTPELLEKREKALAKLTKLSQEMGLYE